MLQLETAAEEGKEAMQVEEDARRKKREAEAKSSAQAVCTKYWKHCSGWMIRKSDSPEDKYTKRGLTPVCIMIGIFVAFLLARNRLSKGWFNLVSLVAILSGFLSFLIRGYFGLDMKLSVDILMSVSATAIMMNDAVTASELRARSWPINVIILDFALVFNAPRTIPYVLGLTLTYLLLEKSEEGLRWGMYDFVGSESPPACSCVDPPCARGADTIVTSYAIACITLVTDFYLTRGFATKLRRQLRRVEASVEVAGEVASALARYDVELAEKAIADGQSELPINLVRSYRTLLRNLSRYKLYLPQSCLVEQMSTSSDDDEFVGPGEQINHSDPISSGSPKAASMADTMSVLSDATSVIMYPEPSSTFQQATKPRKRRVSLAVSNMVGYSRRFVEFLSDEHGTWVGHDVAQWCNAVSENGGVVDLIGGDRRHASFNARRQCMTHGTCAVTVLFSRMGQSSDMEWSGCVVTGQVSCGDFGSATVLRFMVLGPVASSLYPMERLAAKWRIPALVDMATYTEASETWGGTLLGAVIILKRSSRALAIYSMSVQTMPGREEQNERTMMKISMKVDSIAEMPAEAPEGLQSWGVWLVSDVGLEDA
eukprot:Hpha_TRINITY_DN16402_c1_g2::TRINITY_DN16402_c1_g2_i1::g.160950::m.160950